MRVCSSHWLLSLRRESGIREEALEGGCCSAKAGVPQLLAPGPEPSAARSFFYMLLSSSITYQPPATGPRDGDQEKQESPRRLDEEQE